ncbi:MAG: CAP domain-containing protein [Gemmataceae bacterium]
MRWIVLMALLLLVCSPLVVAEDQPFRLGETEQKLLDAANESRSKEKIGKLVANRTLTEIARKHAENMARQEKMEHVLDGKGVAARAQEGGYNYQVIGENLAQATGDKEAPAPSPEVIHKHWMESKPHRVNLLNPKFEHIGIAIVKSPKGTYFYCQVFGKLAK